jgi:hypothetical protein
MATEKKTIGEMIGEFFREAALLVGVFIPLDMVFSEKPISRLVLGFGMTVFVLFFVVGIVIERER